MRELSGAWMRHSGDFWGGFASMLVALPASVAFGVTETTDFPSAEAAYNELAKLFYQATHAGCGPMPSTPVKPTPCDRSTGDIAGRGTVSLTAGPLVLGNVSVLGEVGDVLILANSEDRLFYFVCRSTIGFIG